MSDNKKYYYIKLKESFFNEDRMIILQSMDNGYLYSDILMKMYLKSLKNEGKLMISNMIPYNLTMISQVTRHNIDIVEKSISIFRELGLIDILDNGAIFMLDIQNFIGKSSTEAERKKNQRNSLKNQLDKCRTNVGQMSQECPDISPPESRDKSLESKEKDIYSQNSDICLQNENQEQKTDFVEQSSTTSPSNTISLVVPYQEIVNLFNSTCTSLSKVVSVSKSRKQKIHNRWKELQSIVKIKDLFEKVESTSFLKGNNNKGWKCSFDWLFENDSNWLKVMEGNYDSSEKNSQPHKPNNASFQQRAYSDDYYNSFYEDVSNKVKGGGENSDSN